MKKIFTYSMMAILLVLFSQSVYAQEIKNPKPNTIGFITFTATANGPGLGVFYERNLNPEGTVALNLPLRFNFQRFGNWMYDNNSSEIISHFDFSPGLKFYPIRKRVIEFAVGPSLFFTHGSAEQLYEYIYDPNENDMIKSDYHNLSIQNMGVLGNAYLNVILAKDFVMGAELGIGLNYYHHNTKTYLYTETIKKTTSNFNFWGQFSITFAYRF